MKAAELRIGNLVKIDCSCGRVMHAEILSIDLEEVNVCEVCLKCGTEYWNLNINSIEPIPLTQEWLLKFGFKEMEFNHPDYIPQYYYSKDFEKGKVNLDLRHEMILDYGGDFLSNTIDYVHRFQNICFALTGE